MVEKVKHSDLAVPVVVVPKEIDKSDFPETNTDKELQHSRTRQDDLFSVLAGGIV